MNFISTCSNLPKSFSFADFLVIEGHEQGALWKGAFISSFVEQLKRTTLRKYNW